MFADTDTGYEYDIDTPGQGTATWADGTTGDLWFYTPEERHRDNIFEETKHFRFDKGLYATALNSEIMATLRFKPPQKISVHEEVTIVAGFHGRAQTGVMAINGIDTLELDAMDTYPQSSFPVLLDGEQLINTISPPN